MVGGFSIHPQNRRPPATKAKYQDDIKPRRDGNKQKYQLGDI